MDPAAPTPAWRDHCARRHGLLLHKQQEGLAKVRQNSAWFLAQMDAGDPRRAPTEELVDLAQDWPDFARDEYAPASMRVVPRA
jgi:hypothetical protein